MKRLTTSQRVLGGVLVLAAGAWVVDRWSGTHKPAAAQGASSETTPAPVGPADWHEVNDLVARLTRTEYESEETELAELGRDLFMPTEQFENTLPAAAPRATPAPVAAAAATTEPAEPSFAARHKLGGVVIGNDPLAIIDNRLLPLSAELDGYVLVEMFRDYVVFRQQETGERVVLTLETRVPQP